MSKKKVFVFLFVIFSGITGIGAYFKYFPFFLIGTIGVAVFYFFIATYI